MPSFDWLHINIHRCRGRSSWEGCSTGAEVAGTAQAPTISNSLSNNNSNMDNNCKPPFTYLRPDQQSLLQPRQLNIIPSLVLHHLRGRKQRPGNMASKHTLLIMHWLVTRVLPVQRWVHTRDMLILMLATLIRHTLILPLQRLHHFMLRTLRWCPHGVLMMVPDFNVLRHMTRRWTFNLARVENASIAEQFLRRCGGGTVPVIIFVTHAGFITRWTVWIDRSSNHQNAWYLNFRRQRDG